MKNEENNREKCEKREKEPQMDTVEHGLNKTMDHTENKEERRMVTKDELTDFFLYTAPDGQVKVECILHDETIWLTQKRIAELFGVGVPAISKHLDNIYADEELVREATVSILETVQQEGSRHVKRKLEFYNLDAIISVGYRVNSSKATQFRIWATKLLKEYITKGFAMDDERLKNGRYFGKDYFRELLERVRSIRASERRIYQQITDIFAECSIDYDPKSETTRNFYAHVQDKFHFAITGHTAAEIIYLKADAERPLMGMMTCKNAPDGRVLKSDTTIGKNYLQEDEIKKLERTVTGFFDYIERIIENRTTFTMESFAESVNRFLEFNEYKILEGYGSVSRKQAEAKAFAEYDKFNKTQRIESDFDKAIKQIESSNRKGGEHE
ncbi:MAG: virulence RhuM family protein [Desulfonatronovibrio sp.]